MLHWARETLSVHNLVDSGADGNFIDVNLATQANIPIILLNEPRGVTAIDRNFLVKVIHKTSQVALTLSGNHHESLQLFVISSPLSPVVLGLPWLKKQNPNIDWSSASICDWSEFCHAHCLLSAIPTGTSTPAEPPEEIDLDNIPSEYHDLRFIFSKDRAQTLPPHRP